MPGLELYKRYNLTAEKGQLDDYGLTRSLLPDSEVRMPLTRAVVAAVAFTWPLSRAAGQPPPPALANTIDTVPAGWTGPVFQLSRDYPAALPAGYPKPWKAFDFKTESDQYIRAVLTHCREGNEAVDWVGQDNTIRKWYHAPGLVKGNNGREFIHGLTRERTSPAKELAPTQTQPWTNFAVGLYNPVAAYTIGRVWQDPTAPNADGVKFEDGAVGVKLLFTTAPTDQVPFLADSKEWQANASLPGTDARNPQMVRLLQVDVAVRDERADGTTGWVFGTFMYQSSAPGTSPYDRLVPVGVMWGNDPDLTPAKAATGEKPKESWINPASTSPHLGWLGRLNGPVDNPNSSCLSCHGRAGAPQTKDLVFRAGATDDQKMAYFTNVKAGDPYTAGIKSFDYSLQLGFGVGNFPDPSLPDTPAVPRGFNPRSGEVDPHHAVDDSGPDPKGQGPPGPADMPPPPGPAKWNPVYLLAVGAVVLAAILLALFVIRWKRMRPWGGSSSRT